MQKHNPENERIKREYLSWMKEARGQSEASLDAAAAALHRFEQYTSYRPFKTFHPEQAKAFKRHLCERPNSRTGERLSKATLYSTLKSLKAFFQWLSREPGFRSHINYSDSEYFNLSENDARIAKAKRETPTPSLTQVMQVLASAGTTTVADRRNRALIAFVLLTGARDGAVATFKLKHLDVENERLEQDAREVRTKRRKTFTTWFFPVGDLPRRIVRDWVDELATEHLFGPDDPLFPATKVSLGGSGYFERSGISRRHWSNAAPIRAIFKEAFRRAGLPYFNPHSFRNLLAQLGEKLAPDMEAFKAWSQNLGHEQMVTTLSSYGAVAYRRQQEIMKSLVKGTDADPSADECDQIGRELATILRRRRSAMA